MDYIGKLLDNRYEILEVIGTGGMAVVYKALCHRLNRLVAVKILKDEYFQDAEFRRRFHTESQAVGMLSHPNIVNVYDVSHTDDVDYIVMELIDGITLKQYLEQKGMLNWREALHFSTQIAKALEHAHSRGIIHRDIKPHNIMILKDGSVKVADFGIARMTSAQSTLTREALGSVHYISPEQAKGGKMDCRSDLYSLGVVMYEMLTGKTPFDGDTPVSVAIQHINAKATMPRELNPSIPEGLEQITMRAMEANLNRRYASATDILRDLESFRLNPSTVFEFKQETPEHPITAVPDTPAKPAKPAQPAQPVRQPTKKRTSVIIGAICIALAVAGLIYLLISLSGDFFKKSEEIKLPAFYRMTVDEVQAKYKDQLDLEIEWEFDSDMEYGRILRQDPKADKRVKMNSKVTLVASLGQQEMSMPNLVNYSVTDSQAILQKFDWNFNVKVSYEDSDIYVENYVIRTEPVYGSPLTPGQSIELVVSQGVSQKLVPVPALVGMDEDEALATIERENLGKGNVKHVDSDLPKGTVTFQSIEQGEQVKEGTVINLQVSLGAAVNAQVPVIEIQPASIQVDQGTPAAVSVTASVSDGGQLSYAWFTSADGSTPDTTVLGSGPSLNVSTDTIGTQTYCCKITNTLEDSSVSIITNMAKVTVTEKLEPVTKVLDVEIPDGEGMANIVIKMDGANYTAPFEVDRAQGTIQVSVDAIGTHVIDVYVDGLLKLSKSVNFTE